MRFIDRIRGMITGQKISSQNENTELVESHPIQETITLGRGRSMQGKISPKLKRFQPLQVSMQMDRWKQAIITAEDPREPRRELLYAMYRWTMRDSHLKSQIQTGIKKVKAEAFVILDENGEPDQEKTELLQRYWFDCFIEIRLKTDFYGHSLIEFQPLKDSNSPLMSEELHGITLIPREHVLPNRGEILIMPHDRKGLPYRKGPLAKHLMELGDPEDLGLLLIATKEYIRKAYALNDWSVMSEVYGMPIAVLKTAEERSQELDKKESWLKSLTSKNRYAILDDQDELNMVTNSQPYSYQMYLGLAEFANEEMSKLVNGQTMTAEDGSSLSQSEVHERILNVYTIDRMRTIQYLVNEELLPLLSDRYDYPFQGCRFQYLRFIDEDPDQDDSHQETKPEEKDPPESNFNREVALPGPTSIILQGLYGDCCEEDDERIYLMSDINFWGIVQKIARDIHKQTKPVAQMANELYMRLARQLWDAWKKGYGNVLMDFDWDSPDNALMDRVRGNLFAFSGAKSFSQMQELRDLVYTENGSLRPWTEFRELALQINDRYNETWLNTERDHVVRSGTLGSRWIELEANKDLFPFLKYNTVGDDRVRPEHLALDGIVRPIDDEFWDRYYPPNGYRCRCTADQVSQAQIDNGEETLTARDEAMASGENSLDTPYFSGNVGKEGIVFKEDHPYYESVPGGDPQTLRAVENYGLRSLDRIYANPTSLPTRPDLEDISSSVADPQGIKIPITNTQMARVIASPDEIYHTGSGLKYIKYFDDGAVIAEGSVEGVSLSELLDDERRNGVLLFKK